MQTIELFGPMAVGKSTVYQQCIESRSSASDWTSSAEASQLLISAILKRKSPIKRVLGSIALNFEMLSPLIRDQLAIERLGAEALTNEADKWSKLLTQYVMQVGMLDLSDGLLVLRHNGYLLDFLELLALYNKYLQNEKIFLDEGICKRTGGVLLHCASSLDDGLEGIPLPGALICLNASPETVHSRLLGRQGAVPKERRALVIRDMDKAEIFEFVTEAVQRTNRVCDALESAGLSVLRVSAEQPLSEQVNQILSFVDTTN